MNGRDSWVSGDSVQPVEHGMNALQKCAYPFRCRGGIHFLRLLKQFAQIRAGGKARFLFAVKNDRAGLRFQALEKRRRRSALQILEDMARPISLAGGRSSTSSTTPSDSLHESVFPLYSSMRSAFVLLGAIHRCGVCKSASDPSDHPSRL